jgi:hypothetical protein
MDAQVMDGVAGAVAAAVDAVGGSSEEELSDAAPFAWGADEHGSDVEEDPVQDRNWVQPPPPADGGSAQKSVGDRVRELWIKWMGEHKIKNAGTNPDTTHFAPWAEVGEIQNHRPRELFKAKSGMKRRIRPERGNHAPVTELECFEEMFTPEMQERIIRCTNDKVVRIQNGSYPKPTMTAFLWHDSGPALFLSSAHDTEVGSVMRREAGKSGRTQVPAPQAAADYNAFMCGCDTADQKRAQGSVMAKTYKWYIALFHWILDQCVSNACVLYACETRGLNADGGLDQERTRRFRHAVAAQLVVKAGVDIHALVDDMPVLSPRTRVMTAHDMEWYEKLLKKLPPGRLVGNGHFIDVHDVWRAHCEERVKSPTHRMPQKWNCVLCYQLTGKQFKTEFCCVKCGVTLHPGGCFMQYHLPRPNFELTFTRGGLGNANKSRDNGAGAAKK